MSDSEHQTQILSPYQKNPFGKSILLYTGKVELTAGNEKIICNGRIEFRFKPRCETIFFTRNAFLLPDQIDNYIHLKTKEGISGIFIYNNGSFSMGEKVKSYLEIKLKSDSSWFRTKDQDNQTDSVAYILFHLTNYCDIGQTTLRDENSTWRGRSEFSFGKWKITIDHFLDMRERHDFIKETGYNIFTHVGKIERLDGKLFKVEDCQTERECLQWFLSFIKGGHCGMRLHSGWRKLPYSIWEDWSNYHIDIKKSPSWLPDFQVM
jgi:hypothetical protein